MADLRVTCITKNPTHSDRYEHITHVGGTWGYISREDVIEYIDRKMHRFYVYDEVRGRTGWVEVIREYGKNPYIRTHPDNDKGDNLLSLESCRV